MTSAIRLTPFAAVAGGAPKMIVHNGGRAALTAAPHCIEQKIEWSLLVRARRNRLASGIRPGSLEIVAWEAVEALRLQSNIPVESVGIGAAVTTELTSFPAFCNAIREQAQAAREGGTETRVPQLRVTSAGLHATPPVSLATVSLEPPNESGLSRLVMTFNSTLLAPSQAAIFLKNLTEGIAAHETVEQLIT